MNLKYLLPFLFIIYSCSEKDKNTQVATETSVITNKKGGIISLNFKNLNLEIDSSAGARISSFKVGDKELLYTSRDSNNNNWGSTFWPSPQSLWGWPPPAILDNSPYKVTLLKDTVTLTSQNAILPSINISKTIYSNSIDTSITIKYSMKNTSDSAIKIAPWEISRVPSGGHIVFPKGNDTPRGELQALFKDSLGAVWFDYDSTKIPAGVPKLFADGSEGWLAYANNSRQIIIKKFKDSPLNLKAPDPENEIEIYTHPGNHYIEVEQQGPYELLSPGSSTTWTVKWYARQIPPNVDVSFGSASLLAYIRNVVK